MRINEKDFTSVVSIYNSTPVDNLPVFEFALASAIARRLVARSEDYLEHMDKWSNNILEEHFTLKYRNKVEVICYEINRMCVVDTNRLFQMVQSMFVYMANIFAGCFGKNIIVTNPAGAGDIFNMGHYFQKDLLEAVYENMHLYNKVLMAVQHAMSEKKEQSEG